MPWNQEEWQGTLDAMLASAPLQSIWETEAISSDAQKSKFRLRHPKINVLICEWLRWWPACSRLNIVCQWPRAVSIQPEALSSRPSSFSYSLACPCRCPYSQFLSSVEYACQQPPLLYQIGPFSEKIGGHSKWRVLSWRDYQQKWFWWEAKFQDVLNCIQSRHYKNHWTSEISQKGACWKECVGRDHREGG